MAGLYVDTSALGRVLLGEPDADLVVRELGRFELHASSQLLRVELRRLALRARVIENADQLLSGIALLPLDEHLLGAAETLPPASVATLDAIHLVTALRLAGDGLVETMITYDARLAAGAREHGLAVIAPA